jgi:hypothetical protein
MLVRRSYFVATAAVEARTDRRRRPRLGHRDTNECEAGHLICFAAKNQPTEARL